jgi:cysteine synthase
LKNRTKALEAICSLIGNTPLLEINFLYKNKKRRIFAKAENFNMTGSIKDRMAYHILSSAIGNGSLEPGMEIFEATSGNTGISFSAIGTALGHKVTIYMPDWMSEERKNLIRSYGANIKLVSKEEGGFLGSIRLADEAAEACKGFLPHQFSNCHNPYAHYLSTGPEIHTQLSNIGIEADAFVAGVGTGGTVMGTGRFLKEQYSTIKIHPLEPANSPTLTTGYKVGKHRIQGISDEFIPQVCELNKLDKIICVDDGDAIIMAQKLTAELGLGVGISSGANFLGALIAQEKLGYDANVVSIFCDSNKKYLSTDLLKKETIKEGFLSSEISLLDFRVHQRAFSGNSFTEASMYM